MDDLESPSYQTKPADPTTVTTSVVTTATVTIGGQRTGEEATVESDGRVLRNT